MQSALPESSLIAPFIRKCFFTKTFTKPYNHTHLTVNNVIFYDNFLILVPAPLEYLQAMKEATV